MISVANTKTTSFPKKYYTPRPTSDEENQLDEKAWGESGARRAIIGAKPASTNGQGWPHRM
jgi:hypothetical protein